MTPAIARARADLDAGRHWKARERLYGALADRQDFELLDLLATVNFEMRDLPAAGALWFVTGRDDEHSREAIAAWRERYGNDQARWRSIPSPIRQRVRTEGLQSLRGAAKRARHSERHQSGEPQRHYIAPWFEPILTGAAVILFGGGTLTLIGIGIWTVIHWIWA